MNRIKEIKDRLGKTTPGFWSFSVPQQSLWCTPNKDATEIRTEKSTIYANTGEIGALSKNDIEFLANARQDIEYLLRVIKNMADALEAD